MNQSITLSKPGFLATIVGVLLVGMLVGAAARWNVAGPSQQKASENMALTDNQGGIPEGNMSEEANIENSMPLTPPKGGAFFAQVNKVQGNVNTLELDVTVRTPDREIFKKLLLSETVSVVKTDCPDFLQGATLMGTCQPKDIKGKDIVLGDFVLVSVPSAEAMEGEVITPQSLTVLVGEARPKGIKQ